MFPVTWSHWILINRWPNCHDFGVEWPELDAPTPGSPVPEEPPVDAARDVEMDRRLAEEEISEIEDQDIRVEAEAELEQGIAAEFSTY